MGRVRTVGRGGRHAPPLSNGTDMSASCMDPGMDSTAADDDEREGGVDGM